MKKKGRKFEGDCGGLYERVWKGKMEGKTIVIELQTHK